MVSTTIIPRKGWEKHGTGTNLHAAVDWSGSMLHYYDSTTGRKPCRHAERLVETGRKIYRIRYCSSSYLFTVCTDARRDFVISFNRSGQEE